MTQPHRASTSIETGPDRPATESEEELLLPAETPWFRRPPEIPRLFIQLSAERARTESEIENRYQARVEAADTSYRDGTKKIEERKVAETRATEQEYQEARRRVLESDEAETTRVQNHHKATRKSLLLQARNGHEEAEKIHGQARWEANTVFEASDRGEVERFEEEQKALAADAQTLAQLQVDTESILLDYRKYGAPADAPAPPEPVTPEDPAAALREAIVQADEQLLAIESLKIPAMFVGAQEAWLFVVPWLLVVGPAIYFTNVTIGLIAATVAAAAIGFGLRSFFHSKARTLLVGLQPALRATLAEAARLVPIAQNWIQENQQRRRQEIKERRDQEVIRADRTLAARLAEIEQRRESGLQAIDESSRQKLSELQSRRELALRVAEENRSHRHAETQARHAADAKQLHDEHARLREEASARHRKDWDALLARWQAGMETIQAALGEIREEASKRFLLLDGRDGVAWSPAAEVPPGVRFGEVRFGPEAIPHGVPRDARLRAMTPSEIRMPALLTFPDRGSLLIETDGSGRDEAMRVLQGAMMRFLTSLPPGKVRFTIIDPVGLGRNFAAFMHLADYSELLVNSRIWTEPQQIEQRLADLSLHMENVIQHFLRNEYPTLEEYNRQAGEVAEPYRILVVADFPANFHEGSAQRLHSIATSGARCGVYTLIAVNTDQELPNNFRLDDLEAHAATLRWQKGRFTWKDPDFAPYPLTLDTPPADDQFTRLLHQVGEAARDANRVEVPFETVAPPRAQWWEGDTRAGVDVPLGRSGATKLQNLKLGRGTSQHVLIAGRTGSGKSSLLHALITNAALIYDPDEVELYLIDFKKGVEFKTYAQHELPHARVIAIESEREFGLSVLQRLDEELKRRGDIFRDHNVQDLNGYRNVPDAPPLPRILLIVDEFQEFFVDDDKTAQEAALLLDRLVRQGRAFGVHVNLGSQTLSGAYSLARSTLGQMAVRIALQCSEADAHLILSEDNAAARLLTRPGEAIYNDANGMIEGNHIFQVVWLPDERREFYLKQIKELARQRGMEMPRPQIVFEGNIPSDLRKNHLLRDLLTRPDWPEAPKAAHAWLGEAVAIKDPTAAVFRRQGGNNLIVIGQDNDAARGLFAAAILGLASQYPPDAARFYVLDGTPEDDPIAGSFESLGSVLPHPIRFGGLHDATPILEELAADLARRQEGVSGAPSVFLFLYDMSRFRDLRKSDDDFGYSFGRRDEEKKASPAQQFSEFVREGPALGMHAVAWFDTLNNVNRVLDRQGLREFEMRVLFQMSANDSSNLIDTPIANRLGPNRALYASEEQGKLEKFRPYGFPPRDWLDWSRDHWQSRTPPSTP